MARLDYDEDNFSGRYSRGVRYDIYVNGIIEYSDIPEESVDRLCDDIERRYRYMDNLEIELRERT